MKLQKIDSVTDNWTELCSTAEANYKYQPHLTPRLDAHEGDFTEQNILEIVLWKVNRYPHVTDELLEQVNLLRRERTEESGQRLLEMLLKDEYRGFDLPMASTLLRFACPELFQIIDQRVYRFIMPEEHKLKIPYNWEAKVNLYFRYLKRLKEECALRGIPFEKSDRILYQMDKDLNKNTPIH